MEHAMNKPQIRIGSDTDKLPDHLKAQEFEGAFFRLMLDLSPTLDLGELREIPGVEDFRARSFGESEREISYRASAEYLRKIIAAKS